MKNNPKKIIFAALVVLVALLLYWFQPTQKSASTSIETPTSELVKDYQPKSDALVPSDDVTYLSSEKVVLNYVKAHHELPDYYITKNQARQKGWDAKSGNLCEVLHGRVIGGDRFGNFEHQLPDAKGRKWTEADINYECGRRGASRLIFSNDGLIFVTYNHYKSFQQR